jgi:hypothetical protein
LYCARAWWYQRQGIESSNQVELSAGSKLHHQHGRLVMASGLLRTLGLLLLLASLLMLVSYCTARIL